MELGDQIRLNAPRARVFEALNDPALLRQAIPGCEALEAVSPTEFTATVAAKIGPLAARFTGQVALSEVMAPESYVLTGEGKGGPAGFAKVRARVALAEDGEATLLNYTVKADIGGKLGQLGGAIVDRTARKLAGEFFQNFEGLLGARAAPVAPPARPVRTASVPWWWLIAVAAAVAFAWSVLR